MSNLMSQIMAHLLHAPHCLSSVCRAGIHQYVTCMHVCFQPEEFLTEDGVRIVIYGMLHMDRQECTPDLLPAGNYGGGRVGRGGGASVKV